MIASAGARGMNGTASEWVRLEAGAVVVATDAAAWVHRPSGWAPDDPFLRPMETPGTPATTRNLLDGVIACAQPAVPPASPPAMTLHRWAWRLAGYYHTTEATPRLMAEAARRFTATGRPELAAYALGKVADEAGHDALALRDLRALGLPAGIVVRRWIPPTAAALVNYFTGLVRSDFPVAALGYAYALERLALTSGDAYIASVEAVLPPGVRATRCLRVHSALGSDLSHTEDLIAVAAGLPAVDRIRIAHACHETARLCSMAPDSVPSDEVLAEDFQRFIHEEKEVFPPR